MIVILSDEQRNLRLRPTDTLYIKLRVGESVDNEILDDGDIIIDIGADGALLGYEIQHASTKRDFIAGVILGEERPVAVAE
jgi:uncharacterized protein YuzE